MKAKTELFFLLKIFTAAGIIYLAVFSFLKVLLPDISGYAALFVLFSGVCVLISAVVTAVYCIREKSAALRKMDSILSGIPEAVITVNRNLKITYANPPAYELLRLEHGSVVGTCIDEAINDIPIRNLFMRAVKFNKAFEGDLDMGKNDCRHIKICARPMPACGGFLGKTGSIVIIQDISAKNKAERIQSEFVSNVTHELKTPLTSIKGFIETLKNGAVKDPEIANKFLEIIDSEAGRLHMLINDILQLSQIENLKKDANVRRNSLNSIVSEVISILSGQARKKGITISRNIEKNLYIIANRDRLKQMLINLIDNAIKYNVEEGIIEISARKDEKNIFISIRDTGIGIDVKHIDRIFDRFYRVDKGRSRGMGGTGLGLSIVKHIVDLYGGNIDVRSVLGEGTEFVITLPV